MEAQFEVQKDYVSHASLPDMKPINLCTKRLLESKDFSSYHAFMNKIKRFPLLVCKNPSRADPYFSGSFGEKLKTVIFVTTLA